MKQMFWHSGIGAGCCSSMGLCSDAYGGIIAANRAVAKLLAKLAE
jgi:hypothetical protein